MKKYFLLIIIFLFFKIAVSQQVSFMTYNIRLDVKSDKENSWPNRKDFLVSQISFFSPDIFGIQEGLPHQVNYIYEQIPGYSYIGEGRDGTNRGEYSALYFNTEKFFTEEHGTFWLSLTPNIVSKGWDAAFPRICTYALFKDKKTEMKFWVFNTHLDHLGRTSRLESAGLILKKINELNTFNFPVILMGDFNAKPNSIPITVLKNTMNDSREVAIQQPFGPEGTFNSFHFTRIPKKRIDYIFISKGSEVEVEKYAVLNNSKNNKYPSDHFPIYVEIIFNKKQ